MNKIPRKVLLAGGVLIFSALLYAQDKTKPHENPDGEIRHREVLDAIYARRPAPDREEKQEALLKSIRGKEHHSGLLWHKFNLDIGIDFFHDIASQGRIPFVEAEARLMAINDRMKLPKGVTAQELEWYRNRKQLLALLKKFYEYRDLSDSVAKGLINFSVGSELCHCIYSDKLLLRTHVAENRKEDYENNAGVNFTVKAKDNSYYTLCTFPYSGANDDSPRSFVLHFDKNFKLFEAFQSNKPFYDLSSSSKWTPVNFAFETKDVLVKEDYKTKKTALVFTKKEEIVWEPGEREAAQNGRHQTRLAGCASATARFRIAQTPGNHWQEFHHVHHRT